MPLAAEESQKKKWKGKAKAQDSRPTDEANDDTTQEENKAVDTGFWKKVNHLLESKYRELGKARDSDPWKAYVLSVIWREALELIIGLQILRRIDWERLREIRHSPYRQ